MLPAQRWQRYRPINVPGRSLAATQRPEPAGTAPTYHALHLLGDITVSVTSGSLGVHCRLPRTLGAELQVSGQRAAAALVPAQTHVTSDQRPRLPEPRGQIISTEINNLVSLRILKDVCDNSTCFSETGQKTNGAASGWHPQGQPQDPALLRSPRVLCGVQAERQGTEQDCRRAPGHSPARGHWPSSQGALPLTPTAPQAPSHPGPCSSHGQPLRMLSLEPPSQAPPATALLPPAKATGIIRVLRGHQHRPDPPSDSAQLLSVRLPRCPHLSEEALT